MADTFGNSFMKLLICSPLHPLVGKNLGVITVTGSKTGRSISLPVNVSSVHGIPTVISKRDRTWWRNLRGGRTAKLHLAGKTSLVRAETVENPELINAGLKDFFNEYPANARYFGINPGVENEIMPEALQSLSEERVLIRFFPI
jgi:hypothetical protein